MKEEISLAEWKAEQEQKVRAFELYWKHASHHDTDFPPILTKQDWDEQFEFYTNEVF